ncbi:MAG: hypothetical protein O2890_11085 [Cyanobacteria bacterium]|nr:hypothetical protein [Cyanobacteriota bacterium]
MGLSPYVTILNPPWGRFDQALYGLGDRSLAGWRSPENPDDTPLQKNRNGFAQASYRSIAEGSSALAPMLR